MPWRAVLPTLTLAVWCAGCASKAPPQTSPVETGPPVEVSELNLIGVESIDEEQLRAVLRTHPSSWLPWADDRLFDREAFAADLQRIVAFYRDNGFPDARVVSHDIDIDEAEEEVVLTVRIDEGEPLRVVEVRLTNFDALTDKERTALAESLPLPIGEPLVHQNMVAGGEMAANALKDRGYPYAEVRVREETVAPGSVRVHYAADPGTQAYFGAIEIVGNISVDDAIIRRELAYRPGDLFRRRLLQDSQQQLFALDLFQFATVEILEADQQPAEVKTRVTVAESKPQRVEFSFGYGTEEKVRGDLAWQHVNFLGGARTLAARTEWSSLTQGAQLDFVQPYLLHRRLRLGMDGHYWRATEPAYTLTSRGGQVSLLGDLSARTTWSLTLRGENATSEVVQAALDDPTLRDDLIALGLNPDTGRQGGLLTSIAVGAQRNTTVNALDPRQGYAVSARLEQAGSWLPGAFDFVEWQIGGRYYYPLTDRVVVASRLQLATIDPSGASAELPFARRYFLGGSTSLRGWGRYEVSPLSRTGLPLGGKSMLESSAEVRARVRGSLGAVVFVDAGNVWRDEWQFDLADMRADAGAGVRYYTPIGPIRVDLAWQLTPIDGLIVDGEPRTRRWRLHFSIGQAF